MLKERVAGIVMTMALAAMVYDCGSSSSSPSPASPPATTPPAGAITWTTVKPILAASCGAPGGGSCHNSGGAGFSYNDISGEAVFKTQKAQVIAALNGGTGATPAIAMPLTPGVISDADKKTIITYLGQ